jgi:hypothetical protein
MLQVTGGNLANLLPNIAANISVLGAIIDQFACALFAIVAHARGDSKSSAAGAAQ